MEYIAHRINTIEQLKKIPHDFGVELDLRDKGERIILAHDPFTDGEDFEEYLKHYQHGTMILNIKSERIEHAVLGLMRQYNIKNYFFLDSSIPMMCLLADEGIQDIAVRFSEYESLETVLSFKGKIKWVWVDCFTKLPITKIQYDTLKKSGFRLCLVSPELQGREEEIAEYKEVLKKDGIIFDAICTKYENVAQWQC